MSPRDACVKLNTDWASKGNPGHAAAEGVIRDSNDNMIGSFPEYLGLQTSVFAKAKAIMQGITLANRLGLRVVWIETDSLLIVNSLNGLVDVPCTISYIIQDIKNSPQNF